MKESVKLNITKFRNSLLYYAINYRVSREDAEELVNDVFLKALENFDNDRGSFEAYCKVILKNLIFNFKRDHKDIFILLSLDDENQWQELYEAEIGQYKKQKKNQTCIDFLNGLISKLNETERKLLEQMSKVSGDKEKAPVSKAARNLGIEPLKGWDIFRGIQRKAKKYYEEISDSDSSSDFINFYTPKFEKITDEKLMAKYAFKYEMIIIEFTDSDNEKFFNLLTDIQKKKLSSIYG